MTDPVGVHPSMAKSDLWPVSPAETALLATFAYLVLLIGLAGARLGGPDAPPPTVPVLANLVASTRPEAVPLRLAAASCVTERTVPRSYAGAPGVEQRLAFGPPVEPTRPLGVAEVNGVLIQRLCGGAATPGGHYQGPDRRLYVAIDAAVNGRDPNRPITRSAWRTGVDRFVVHDALWSQAKVVTARAPRGTVTFGMRPRPDADPLVLRTRLAAASVSRYLVLPVRNAGGLVVTVTLRLACGFQPTL